MNGEIRPSVPIVTLAGVSSITNLLTELPLPVPKEPHGKKKTLLFNPRVAEEARRVLSAADPNIVSQMAHVLQQTNVDYVCLKEGYTDNVGPNQVPELVQALMAQYPNALGAIPRHAYEQGNYAVSTQSYVVNHQNSHGYQENMTPVIPGQVQAPYGSAPMAHSSSYHTPGSASNLYHSYPHSSANAESQQPRSSQPGYTPQPQHQMHQQQMQAQRQQVAPQQHSTRTSMDNINSHGSNSHSYQPTIPVDPLAQPFSASSQPWPVDKSQSSQYTSPAVSGGEDVLPIGEAVVALQPLSADDISKYMETPEPSKPSEATELKTSQPGQPTIRLTKLELSSSQYQIGASEGLKLKITKSSDGSARIKDKRRRSSGEEADELPKKKKKKHKNKEHKSLRRESTLATADIDAEYSSAQLIAVVDGIIDSCSLEDLPSTTTAFNDDTDFHITSDVLISRAMLSDLINEAAKLRDTHVTKELPTDRLSKLMLILQWNIRDGAKLSPIQNNAADAQEQVILQDIVLDRIHKSLDATLAALYLMTSQDMPKVVYVEDLIELIADMVKYHLSNCVYPEYDPVYDTRKDKEYSSDKKKRARASGSKNKSITIMYNKLCDVLQNLADLIVMEPLTDTIVLKISSLAIQPFFVENVSELQLSALSVVTEIFSRYEKHRQLILDDMFLSLARLPTTKRNIRTYRLNHEEQIQMVTALVLQLIQSIVKLPSKDEDQDDEEAESSDNVAHDVIIATSYEQAMKTAHHFLSVFLKKCAQKGEEDYRPLFDNFVNDLLVTANKPEWPSSELMLSLLGRLLVQQFSNKQVEMALRVASLDYLGTVAARLRKDAVSTQESYIDYILTSLDDGENSDDEEENRSKNIGETSHKLQLALLEYLLVNGQRDSALLNARKFYIAQWYRDIVLKCEKIAAKQTQVDPNEIEELERAGLELSNAEMKKKALLDQAMLPPKTFSNICKLSYSSAGDVAKFLTSQRPFAHSFDLYLTQILKVLSETAVAVRTKAIKCLTLVIEADPNVLGRSDMQNAVHGRLLDQSTSVREACVELIGKFILNRPKLINQYYEMLSDRILDTGISVRKRVIKIFRDICVEMPNYEKIPDMCVKMIRRVNDEDGIKKLVSEVFQSMWFTPVRDKDTEKLMRRVLNITSVISAIQDANYEFMEQLMKHLLLREVDSNNKPMELSCKQIIDCLVMNVLKLEQRAVELSQGKIATSKDLLASLSTLHLFSKIRPDLITAHAETLQPYLEIKCSNSADIMVLHHTARILELVIPLLDNPRESFLAQVEEDLMTLTLSQGMTVLQSAVSCLGAIVNKVTKNYALVRDCFKKFQNIVFNCHKQHQANPENPALKSRKAALRRSLFTIGVLCRHFDFDSDDMGMKSQAANSIEDFVFEQLMYFLWHEDENVRQQALTALGLFCIRYHDKMMNGRVKDLYHKLLIGKDVSIDMRIQVLNNLGKYLQEEEDRQVKAEEQWKIDGGHEDLKEMGDVQSGMASTIVQVFLKQVLESYFNSKLQVRIAAVNVLHLILKQGLIHPVPCVPYLIAMSTDCDSVVTIKADQHLLEIDKKYSGFVHMKAMAGLKMSFRLHQLVQRDTCEPIRGIRGKETPQALNHYLYSLIRCNRAHRRALLTSMLKLFDDTSKTKLRELVYIADNLAFFPYQAADEPLFVIHNIDIIVSVAGSNILQAFRESILTKDGTPYIPPQEIETTKIDPDTGEVRVVKILTGGSKLDQDDEDDDMESLIKRLPADCTVLQELLMTAQGCTLLLQVKQHLKEMYAISDSKLSKYSPNEAQKVWERPVSRKNALMFNPSNALEMLRMGSPCPNQIDDLGRLKLIEEYLQFKALIMLVDPNDDDDDEKKAPNSPPIAQEDEFNESDNPSGNNPGIASYGLEEADALASSMQPTISLMPLGDIPPEYLAQLQGPSTSGTGETGRNTWDSDEDTD